MLNRFYDKYIFVGGLKYQHNNFYLMGIPFVMIPTQLLLSEKLVNDHDFNKKIYYTVKSAMAKGLMREDTPAISKSVPEIVEATKAVAAPAIVTGVTTAKTLVVRHGPDTTFKTITSLPKNTTLTVVGRNADNSWLQIQIPGKADLGWISKDFVKVLGNINSLPVKMSKSSK